MRLRLTFGVVIAVCAVIACTAYQGIPVPVPTGRAVQPPPETLDIYFIDVEGGQSTLIVTPAGETLLIDAGFPGDGTFRSKPGDPRRARDAQRILAAARAAGVQRIDYLLVTHFHADHDGGVPELAQLLPIRTFIDHGGVLPEAEKTVGGTDDALAAYAAVRATGRHIEPTIGQRLPLEGVTATVVSTAGETIKTPLLLGGAPNAACGPSELPPQEPNENPRSTGIHLVFGAFQFLDLGDLTGKPLFNLFCPVNLIGSVDAYLVSHHGGADAADPATVAARVVIVNNGPAKGGAPETLETLHKLQRDVWQLHRSQAPEARNFPDDRIANLDNQTAHWIKLSAHQDRSFEITNGRTGERKRYPFSP